MSIQQFLFRGYCGTHTSLYLTLEQQYVTHLEHAVWFRRLGEYEKAHALFRNELAPVKDIPVVLIERCELFSSQQRIGDMWTFLDPAVRALRSSGADLEREDYRLIMLWLVHIRLCHQGNVEIALEALHQTRIWLWDTEVSQYSDIMASCVRQYLYLHSRTMYCSNRIEPEAPFIPRPISNRVAWQGLTDLRHSMTTRGMIVESINIHRFELYHTPPTERLPAIKSFLEELKSLLPPSLPELLYLETDLSYQRAQYLPRSGELQLKNEIDHCSSRLKEWAALVGLKDTEKLPRHLSLRYELLASEPDGAVKLEKALELHAIMAQRGHQSTISCLDLASQQCRRLAIQEASQQRWIQFHNLQQKLENYHLNFGGDVLSMVDFHISILGQSLHNGDARKALEWIDGFLCRYPDFSSPNHLSLLFTMRYTLTMTLGDKVAAEESLRSLENIRALLPVGVGYNSGIKPPTIPVKDDDIENSDTQWLRDFHEVAHSVDRVAARAMGLILDFAEEGLQGKTLGLEELHILLNCSCDGKGDSTLQHSSLIHKLKTCDPLQLFIELYMPEVEPGVLDNSRSKDLTCVEARCNILTEWLSRPAKVSKNRRWLLLFYFYDSRRRLITASWIGGDSRYKGLVTKEGERFLRLFSQMPSAIKESRSGYTNYLHAELANAYQIDITATGKCEALTKCEAHSQQARNGFRSYNEISLFAAEQRRIAEINLVKGWRLVIEGGDPMETAIQIKRLCAEGLDALHETDAILTNIEMEATWLEGLKSITERSQLPTAWSGCHTVGLAIHCHQLHMSIRPFLPEAPEKNNSCNHNLDMWEWVQKYKARTLSRTMGTSRSVPVSLLSMIKASPKSKELYSQFLEIQRNIQSAQPQSRFYLRKEREKHLNQMRKDTVLRRLLDVREGAPLTLPEMRKIATDAGNPVVFVDWLQLAPLAFYKPSLLLFTLRIDPGSEFSSDPEFHFGEVKPGLEAVDTWIKETLETKDLVLKLAKGNTRGQFVGQFSGLVKPLSTWSRPGDILILCPTASLHMIPLHALEVEMHDDISGNAIKKPLIHRNPIVYSYSHSLLRTCLSDSTLARESEAPSQPLFLNGIHSMKVVTEYTDYTAGRRCVERLGQQHNVAALTDENATKDSFLLALRSSRLLHIVTHCGWSHEDPLAHHIELPDGPENVTKITAAEFFDLRLQPGSHVNLIACAGGRTHVDAGDEVKGLVPALLFAGASSTVSTLWPILDRDGATFSAAFFKSLGGVAVENKDRSRLGRSLDLAKVVQKAVTEMDPDFDKPLLSWAAYMLHGYWMFPGGLNEKC